MRRILLAVFLTVFALLSPLPAAAELRIDVTRGVTEPVPIAVNSFTGDSTGQQISEVVTADLQRSGLFRPIPPSSFIERGLAVDATPNFANWRSIGAQATVVGRVTRSGNNLTVEFRLWDVLSNGQMIGRRFTTTAANWRQLSHMIADAIYSRLTGEKGYFNTRIVFIADSGPYNRRVKRLAIMDQDGANLRYLTDGRSLVLTPRFSPDEQKITYMSYEGSKPSVYLYDLTRGNRQRLGDFPGMTFAPRFSPDGRSVIMSLAKNGNTDLYRMDLSSRRMTRLSSESAIETSPSYSPDGGRIVFESDRAGGQQLYTMGADGSGVKRITFGKGRYANPVWSPRGDLIAFTRMYQGQFYVGVIRPDGTGERMISTSYHVEGPTWAPNGRVLMYFKETPSGNGRYSRLYTIDLTGANDQTLNLPTSASDPAWSPHLQ
jgi:TolB protein